MRKLIIWNLALFSTAFMFSCSDSDDPKPEENLEAVLVENLHAPADQMGRDSGEIIGQSSHQYCSVEEDKGGGSKNSNRDIGFKGRSIIVNSGISGEGNAEAAIVQGVFEQYDAIPESVELKRDTEEGLAIPTGSGNGWYNYNMTTHTVSPQPRKILIIKTNAG